MCKVKITDETQFRLQLQQEIDREAKIDRLIEAKTKKFLKHNKQFQLVGNHENCDATIIYHREDLSTWYVRLSHEDNYPIEDLDKVTCVYIKNKNKHDNRLHTYSFLRDRAPSKKYSKFKKLK